MNEVKLFTPGPTSVPQAVRDAESLPMIHHRSEEFGAILKKVRDQLNSFVDCDGESLLIASSGTGGLEAAVSSLFSPGDEVIVVEGGKFGERWIELAKHYQLKADVIHVEWGKAVKPDQVLSHVKPTTRGILMQACESSTGAYHPVEKIGKQLNNENVLLVIDAITALGVHDLSMKRDHLDVVISASQKAFMCAPGLAMVSLSQKALKRLEKTEPKSFYFSLKRELKAQQKNQSAFTPAISLVRSLAASFEIIEREGKSNWFAKNLKFQKITRNAFREHKFELFNSDEDATIGITVVKVPTGMDAKAWLKNLKLKYGLWLAGGQGELEGKIFRISHMGDCDLPRLQEALSIIFKSIQPA